MISAEVKEQLRQELLEAMEDYVEERVRLVIERVSDTSSRTRFQRKDDELSERSDITPFPRSGISPCSAAAPDSCGNQTARRSTGKDCWNTRC